MIWRSRYFDILDTHWSMPFHAVRLKYFIQGSLCINRNTRKDYIMAKYVEHRFVNRDKSSGLHGLRDAIQRHDLMALLQCMANGTDLSKALNQVSSSCTIKSHSTPYVPSVRLTHVLPSSPAGSLRVSASPRRFSVWEELPPAGGFLDPEWVRTFALHMISRELPRAQLHILLPILRCSVFTGWITLLSQGSSGKSNSRWTDSSALWGQI